MKKMKYMKYFLDHPQIKRGKTVGNGNSAGSYRYGLNWGSSTKEAPKPQKSSGGINFFRNKFNKLTGPQKSSGGINFFRNKFNKLTGK